MRDVPSDWRERLMAPLPSDEIKLRIGRVWPKDQKMPYSDGTKAEFLAYHDARHVMDRLDEVVGPERWSDEYVVLDTGAVSCRLSILIEGTWLSKEDVGYPNNPANPEPEALKSAYSDALKRAGVKWGIGRYLYALPQSGWWPVDKWGQLSPTDEAKLRKRLFGTLDTGAQDDTPAQAVQETGIAESAPAEPEPMTADQRKRILEIAETMGMASDDYAGLKGLLVMLVNKRSMRDLTYADAERVLDWMQSRTDEE